VLVVVVGCAAGDCAEWGPAAVVVGTAWRGVYGDVVGPAAVVVMPGTAGEDGEPIEDDPAGSLDGPCCAASRAVFGLAPEGDGTPGSSSAGVAARRDVVPAPAARPADAEPRSSIATTRAEAPSSATAPPSAATRRPGRAACGAGSRTSPACSGICAVAVAAGTGAADGSTGVSAHR
jgi:hypothetical protein